jgi:hypothetical protein
LCRGTITGRVARYAGEKLEKIKVKVKSLKLKACNKSFTTIQTFEGSKIKQKYKKIEELTVNLERSLTPILNLIFKTLNQPPYQNISQISKITLIHCLITFSPLALLNQRCILVLELNFVIFKLFPVRKFFLRPK